jgi:hypothetical protein
VSDFFIDKLIETVYEKTGLQQNPETTEEGHEFIIDGKHPILMSYDDEAEHLLLTSVIDIDVVPVTEQSEFYQYLLRAALNPLQNNGPGVGIEDESGKCITYILVERHLLNVDLVCQKMVELIDWNEKLLSRSEL